MEAAYIFPTSWNSSNDRKKKNVPFENEAEEKTFSLSLILDLIVKVRKRVSCSELHYTT